MASPLSPFRRALVSAAASALGLADADLSALESQLRVPEAGRGDLALPAFELARRVKEAPPEAAKKIAAGLAGDARWAKVEAVGPYVNVTVSAAPLAEAVVSAARAPGYGTDAAAGTGKCVVIDFSSPNIAKPLAFHHIRSTVIGAAIGRLHAARGWRVVGINYLGDWGKQFGLLATGFKRFGDPRHRGDAKHLVEVYVRANKEADVESLRAAVRAPEEMRALAKELAQAREDGVKEADPKAKKKIESRIKTLEKRVPTAELDTRLAELEDRAKGAEAQIPEADARDREARLYLKRMEDGDAEALAEWKEFRETSVADFLRVYERMGIEFFDIEGESRYTPVLEATVEKIAKKPGVRESDGALVVDMKYEPGEPPVLLKTKDGTTLYMTRDVAAAIDRNERFAFDRSLYVVAQDQALHFAQLKKTLLAMGLAWSDKMTHVAFGRVHGMSTRRGNVIFLDEVLDEAVYKAREICEKSESLDKDRLNDTVEAIGVGAVVFGDLRNLRASDYTFKLEDVINFDGLTGPYVQYTHARLASIVRKAGGVPPEKADLARLVLDEERSVMLALARLPDAVAEATDAFEPSILTRAVLELSQATSHYLTSGNQDRTKRILVEDEAVRGARLHLVDAVRAALATGLEILGVRAPDAM
jgi:arginyl-tRNA synthetase